MEKSKTCATCFKGRGPLSAGGVKDKCYCKRTKCYEDANHYCSQWVGEVQNSSLLEALAHCAEFLCDECPYQKWDSNEYKLRCIHMLIVDLNEMLNGG